MSVCNSNCRLLVVNTSRIGESAAACEFVEFVGFIRFRLRSAPNFNSTHFSPLLPRPTDRPTLSLHYTTITQHSTNTSNITAITRAQHQPKRLHRSSLLSAGLPA